jgi:phi LC3 family holin
MINWKVRVKSPQFWLGLIGTIMSPILAYLGLKYTDLTTWDSIGNVFVQFIQNPYLIGTVVLAVLSFIGVVTDPTTSGFQDSIQAKNYDAPKTFEEQLDEIKIGEK